MLSTFSCVPLVRGGEGTMSRSAGSRGSLGSNMGLEILIAELRQCFQLQVTMRLSVNERVTREVLDLLWFVTKGRERTSPPCGLKGTK